MKNENYIVGFVLETFQKLTVNYMKYLYLQQRSWPFTLWLQFASIYAIDTFHFLFLRLHIVKYILNYNLLPSHMFKHVSFNFIEMYRFFLFFSQTIHPPLLPVLLPFPRSTPPLFPSKTSFPGIATKHSITRCKKTRQSSRRKMVPRAGKKNQRYPLYHY